MYDLKKIKSIPCGDVAKKYGLKLKKKHNRLWGKLRENEKTESFSINLEKNLWYDFGSGKGGSVIDLVAEIEGISATEAIHKIAKEYGIKKEKSTGWSPLTDSQYREIGIQPERATMNFSFDLRKHTRRQLARWGKKYGIPVKELAEKHPEIYNKMVTKIGLKEITSLKNAYYESLKTYKDPKTNANTKEFIKSMAKKNAEKINRKVELLQRAIISPTKNYMHLKVNFKKDFKQISEDEKIRNRVVKAYKELFDFQKIDYFTVEQIKALQEVNRTIFKADNKYMPITKIYEVYKGIGLILDTLETKYSKLTSQERSDNQSQVHRLENEIEKLRKIFNNCNTAIEGIKQANYKNELSSKDVSKDVTKKMLQKSIELT